MFKDKKKCPNCKSEHTTILSHIGNTNKKTFMCLNCKHKYDFYIKIGKPKLNYKHSGDIIYGSEMYRYRYKNQYVAEIELLNFIDDDLFTYKIKIKKENIPKKYVTIDAADFMLKQQITNKPTQKTTFNKREDALQDAIDVINAVID